MAWPKHLQRPANGPGKGAGWGGPARGASTSRIKPGDPDGIQAMSNDPDIKAKRQERLSTLRDVIYGLATGTDADGEPIADIRHETKLAAAVAYLNREEGTPIARTITANVSDPNSLTDADLAAIAIRGRADIAGTPDDTAEPARVVN